MPLIAERAASAFPTSSSTFFLALSVCATRWLALETRADNCFLSGGGEGCGSRGTTLISSSELMGFPLSWMHRFFCPPEPGNRPSQSRGPCRFGSFAERPVARWTDKPTAQPWQCSWLPGRGWASGSRWGVSWPQLTQTALSLSRRFQSQFPHSGLEQIDQTSRRRPPLRPTARSRPPPLENQLLSDRRCGCLVTVATSAHC